MPMLITGIDLASIYVHVYIYSIYLREVALAVTGSIPTLSTGSMQRVTATPIS